MKPPPRTRAKPKRSLSPESGASAPCGRKGTSKWQQAEKRKLLHALKELSRSTKRREDIDYGFLRKRVATRSIPEIRGMVEALKHQVITHAKVRLSAARREEKATLKPIQLWTHMASAVAGTLEETLSSAFAQMLTVASTEPCTLRNSDPPQVLRPPSDGGRPVGHTVPLRPMPCLPVKGTGDSGNATGPVSCNSTSANPQMPPRFITSDLAPGFGAELHTRFGRTNKYTTEDRTFGVKCVVDFERIYHYLSVIHKPDVDCQLTLMESAIVLDLLMSLPEELSLLDCSKLGKHLIQMYQCLSSPVDSRITRETFKDLRDGPSGQRKAQTGGSSSRVDPEEKTPEHRGASGSFKFCPVLNPFVVPLSLLRRR